MNRNTIENLLRDADAAFESSGLPPADLASRVIRRSAQRRAANIAIGLAVTVAATGAAVTFLHDMRTGPEQDRGKTTGTIASADPPAAFTAVAETRQTSGPNALSGRNADRTAAEVRVHQLVVDRLLAAERKRRGLAKSEVLRAKVDPIVQIDRHVEQAAFVIVNQADRKIAKWNLTDSAASDYRRVIELFPKTRWAEVARQRLAGIKG